MMHARFAWLLCCALAAGWLAMRGVPIWLNASALVCAIFPVVTGIFLRQTAARETAAGIESALWIGLATLGAASTGGAQSALLILFGVALAIAVMLNDNRLMLETAIFCIAGYVVALVADSMGGWLGLGLQLEIGKAYGAAGVALLALLAVLMVGRGVEARRRDNALEDPEARAGRLRVRQIEVRLKAAEAETRKANRAAEDAEQALAVRTRFFAQTSHELRTPLNAIIGFADMMRNAVFGPMPEKYQEYAELIREGGRNLEIVVDDVLDLSRIEAGKYEIFPEILSLTDIAEDAVRFLGDMARRKQITLEVDTEEDAEAYVDAKAARQIALNLISNALKFTPEGGAVKVSAVETPAGALLAVSDTGQGISAEELGRLSRAFEQGAQGREQKGSGLGLSVVRAFAELHGGRLEIESNEGGGTTVGVYFPGPQGE